jgi:hypothetical protein
MQPFLVLIQNLKTFLTFLTKTLITSNFPNGTTMDNHNCRLDFDSSCDSLDFGIQKDGELVIDLQDGEVFANDDARRESESNNASISSLRSLSASAKSLSSSARNLVNHNDVRNSYKRSLLSRRPPSSMRNLRNSGSEGEFSPRPSSDRRKNKWNVGPDQLFGKKGTTNIGGDFYFDLSYLNE